MYSPMSMRTIACVVVEQELGQRPGQLGLADTRRAEEHERPDRPVGVGQPGPAAADRVGDRGDRGVLADDPLVEVLLEVDQLGRLGLHQPAHRHAGPLGDDLGDVLGVDLLLEHALVVLQLVEVRRRLLDAPLELGDAAVADLGGDVEVGLPLQLRAQLLELLLQRADGVDGLALGLPVPLHLGRLGVQRGQLVVQRVEAGLATRRRSPSPGRPARSRAAGCAARRRRSRSASSRSRCAACWPTRRRGRWPCRAGSGW